MTNVSVSGPIIAFHDEGPVQDDVHIPPVPEYLQRRENAERAAAKSSVTLAAQRAHQELAQLIYAARKEVEGAGRQPEEGEAND